METNFGAISTNFPKARTHLGMFWYIEEVIDGNASNGFALTSGKMLLKFVGSYLSSLNNIIWELVGMPDCLCICIKCLVHGHILNPLVVLVKTTISCPVKVS